MKVIFKPDVSTWTYDCTCSQCTSKLQADQSDLLYKISERWESSSDWGGHTRSYDDYYVTCPICSKEIDVPHSKVPFLLQEQVKKVYNENNQKSRRK